VSLLDDVVSVAIEPGDDRSARGRAAAALALARFPGAALAYDGTRPIVIGADAKISITHGRTRAYAIAAAVAKLGIDVVDDADHARLAWLADRYLAPERAIAVTARDRAACFAAKEAGLKALGKGLLDGGMFDPRCAVRVVSLAPPLLDPPELSLAIARTTGDDGTLAIAFAR
jgi:phosphopantetheinyl transferase (holo-ACP synthase)